MFGLGGPPLKYVLIEVGCASRGIGKPDWKVVIPLTPQPETILSTTPFTPVRSFFPFPKGKGIT